MIWTHRKVGVVAAALGLILTTGCNLKTMLQVDPKAEALARTAFDQFRHGDDADLMAELDPAARTPQNQTTMIALRGLVPKGEPTADRSVGWNVFVGTGGERITLTRQYDYESGVITFQTVMMQDKGKIDWKILSFNVSLGTEKAPVVEPPRPPAAAVKT